MVKILINEVGQNLDIYMSFPKAQIEKLTQFAQQNESVSIIEQDNYAILKMPSSGYHVNSTGNSVSQDVMMNRFDASQMSILKKIGGRDLDDYSWTAIYSKYKTLCFRWGQKQVKFYNGETDEFIRKEFEKLETADHAALAAPQDPLLVPDQAAQHVGEGWDGVVLIEVDDLTVNN